MFKVSQGDLFFRADFVEPVFELFQNPGLPRGLFAKLSRHGLRLTDIKIERGGGSLGEGHLFCSLFNFTTVLRIWMERVELHCLDVTRVTPASLKVVVVDLLEVVASHIQTPFRTYQFAVGLHGVVDGIPAREFLSRFAASAPNNFGPLLASGTVFYYGAQAEQVMSALTVDLSALLTDGVFVRMQVTWDAQKVKSGEIPAIAERRVQAAMGQLGLALGEE